MGDCEKKCKGIRSCRNSNTRNSNNEINCLYSKSSCSTVKLAATVAALLLTSMDSTSIISRYTAAASSTNDHCFAFISSPSLSSSTKHKNGNRCHHYTTNFYTSPKTNRHRKHLSTICRYQHGDTQLSSSNSSSSPQFQNRTLDVLSNNLDLHKQQLLQREKDDEKVALYKYRANNGSTKSSISPQQQQLSPTKHKVESMRSSIKNALNQKLNDYDSQLIKSSSRRYAVSPIPPPLPQSQRRQPQDQHEHDGNVQNYGRNGDNSDPALRNLAKRINAHWQRKVHNNSNDNKNSTTYNIKIKKNDKQIEKITSGLLRTQQKQKKQDSREQLTNAIRNLWKKRNARSIEEGIRRGKINNGGKGAGSSSPYNGRSSYPVEDDNHFYNILEEANDDYELYPTDTERGIKKSDNSSAGSSSASNNKKQNKKTYIARTISGLISALAEEAIGVDVNLELRDDTPIWQKHVDKLSIQFERLGIKQLKMGGLDEALQQISHELPPLAGRDESSFDSALRDINDNLMVMMSNENDVAVANMNKADDIFDKIDVDNSGALDSEELTRALLIASGVVSPDEKSMSALGRLAERLVRLYDTNEDGVIDRDEFKRLVADMTAVKNAQRMKKKERQERNAKRTLKKRGRLNPLRWGRVIRRSIFRMKANTDKQSSSEQISSTLNTSGLNQVIDSDSSYRKDLIHLDGDSLSEKDFENAEDISNDPKVLDAMTKGEGSIVLEDLKLDLRRLIFGAVPLVKKITPGGPLILEPFTFTVTASFNRDDILESMLLDNGLRRLVARALRRRVRSIRDLLDGAVFYGRTWNMASQQAPVVEVPKLTNIEFDSKDRLIITGRAKVRTSPDQPFVENSFKLRTKLGTRENGQYIRLEEPELALMLECPKSIEKNIVALCKTFKLPIPTRPDPIEKFFPLVSPIKKTEDDGFNLGDDNRIRSIFIKDNALRFEISAVLRPGRFLGNHYLAFTVPNRTFIITMDRIREGIRNARENKRQLRRLKVRREKMEMKEKSDRYDRAVAQALSKSNDFGADMDLSYQKELSNDDQFTFLEPDKDADNNSPRVEVLPNRPGFFGRFLEGYLDAAREQSERDRSERLTTAISEFFSSDEDSSGKPQKRGVV